MRIAESAMDVFNNSSTSVVFYLKWESRQKAISTKRTNKVS